jgi:hypothetical protein
VRCRYEGVEVALELSSPQILSSFLFCVGAVGDLNADGMSAAMYSFEIARINAEVGGDNTLVLFAVCIPFALLHLLRVLRCSFGEVLYGFRCLFSAAKLFLFG